MKKLLIACAAAALIGAAKAECSFCFWGNEEQDKTEIKGCQLGVAAKAKKVTGAQLSVFFNRLGKLGSGVQGAFGYNRADKVQNGAQVAFINNADSAALQFGLVCFNKTGFLPVFVFFNFDKHMFGGGDK